MNPIPISDETRLAALVSDPTITSRRWADQAACTDSWSGVDAYFPENSEQPPADALNVCRSCPVSSECLATALVYESQVGYRFGWWGGIGPGERAQIAARLGIHTPGVPIALNDGEHADIARYLRSQDHTIVTIAAVLGCTERTVYRYLANPAA